MSYFASKNTSGFFVARKFVYFFIYIAILKLKKSIREDDMKLAKILLIPITAFMLIFAPLNTSIKAEQSNALAAAPTTYKVVAGDSLWKIAVKYEIGLSELIAANPSLKNPSLIYPGQVINIPEAAPLKAIEDEIFRLVNLQRSYNGLPALTYNWQVARVARIKSQDMINNKYFAHISPVYGSPFKMLEDFGLKFSAAAENIAYGQKTAQDVMNAWMNSPGHKANILSKSVTQIGVGCAKASNGTLYFTQLFIKPV
jgi:uncharacterized YkwD family protein/spore coat assembly protein SafA